MKLSRSFYICIFRQPTPILNNITCPTGFILFNNLCYYVDTSPVSNTGTGEQVCSAKYENSTLVKFDLHELSNTDTTEFLGRAFDDILLELFYYELEKKLIIETGTSKHWLRLLLGNNNDESECVLRYFNRSTGGFTISYRCNEGGYPVCQSQPIITNETITNPSGKNIILLLIIMIVPLLALIILTGTAFLVYYFRRNRGSRSTRAISRSFNFGRKPLPTLAIPNETCDTADIIYTELETFPPSIPMDVDKSNLVNNVYTTIEESSQPS
jgi:hypothetical protein